MTTQTKTNSIVKPNSVVKPNSKVVQPISIDTKDKQQLIYQLLKQEDIDTLNSFSSNYLKKRLSLTLDELLLEYNTNKKSTNNSSTMTDHFNELLLALERNKVLSLGETHSNGFYSVLTIVSPYEKQVREYTMDLINRESLNISYCIDVSNVDAALNIGLGSKVPFDVMVSTLYLKKVLQCKERGIEFSLTLPEFSNLYKRKRCHYSGAEMTLDGAMRVTIDRIDPSVGYVSGNVVSCSAAANSLKNQLFETRVATKGMTQNQLKRTLISLSDLL